MRKLMLLTLAWLLVLAAVAGAAGPMSPEEFARRLDQAAQAMEQGRPEEASRQLPKPVQVALPTGVLTLEMAWLDAGTPPSVRPAVVHRLRSMAEDARALAREGGPGLEARLRQAAEDKALLEQILAGAGYREAEMPGWWDRFWQRIRDWWRSLWDRVGISSGSARVLGTLLVIAAIGTVLWLARDYLRLDRWLRRDRAGAGGHETARPPDSDALRAEAQRLAEAGRVREAIKLLMQAVVSRLHARRLVEYQPRLTGRSYVRQLRRQRPDLVGALEELNSLYEWKVYGQRPATLEEFRRGADLAGRLWEEGSSSSAS